MSATAKTQRIPPKDMAQKERRMATRQIKKPVKDNSEQEVEEGFSQRKRPEGGPV